MALGSAIAGLVGRGMSGNSSILDVVAKGIESLAKAGQTALGSISRLTEAMADLFTAPLANAKALAGVIGPMVAAFNPGIVTRFALALHDTTAVFGAMFLPIMEGLTVYVRKFGDVMAGMLPVFQPLTQAIGQFIADFGTGFTAMIRAAAPLIQALSDGLTWLIQKLTYGIGFLAGAITELLNIIMSMVGAKSRFDPNAQSAGFGTRNVQTGTVQQFAENVFSSNAKNAYNRDTGAKSPQEASEELRKAMDKGREVMKQLAEAVEGVKGWLEVNLSTKTWKERMTAFIQGVKEAIVEGLSKIKLRPW